MEVVTSDLCIGWYFRFQRPSRTALPERVVRAALTQLIAIDVNRLDASACLLACDLIWLLLDRFVFRLDISIRFTETSIKIVPITMATFYTRNTACGK